MNNVNVSSTHIHALGGRISIDIDDVLRHLYFSEGDIVLAGGSLVDGFGSSTSDLDVYVISDKPPKASDFPAHLHHRHVCEDGILVSVTDYMATTGMIVDTQYRTKEQLRTLQTAVHRAFDQASRRTKMLINTMAVADQKTIYRLYSAVVLKGKADFETLMASGLSRDRFCYLLFRNVAGHYPLFNDVAGAWRDGDLPMGCERARLFLSTIAQAFTHMFGNTNSEMKWTPRALEYLPDQYRPLVTRYVELMSRGLGGTNEVRQLILDCINLSDEFFDASRNLLNSTPCFMGTEESERITRLEIDSYRSWHRDLTREFSIRCRLFRSGLPPLTEFLPKPEGEKLSNFLDRSDLQPGRSSSLPVSF